MKIVSLLPLVVLSIPIVGSLYAAEYPGEQRFRAICKGQDEKAKAILLLAHLDVVEAKREDWVRDPFKLVEENGNFYARGASDDKAQTATWVDTFVRLREEKFKPRRTIKLESTHLVYDVAHPSHRK